jgi:hypothetical protein
VGNDVKHKRVENHPNVRSRYFEIVCRIPRFTDVPIDNAIELGIDRDLVHRMWQPALQRFQESASTAARVATGQNVLAVPVQDLAAYQFHRSQHRGVNRNTAEGGAECGDGGYHPGHLRRHRTRQQATQAVPDHVDLSLLRVVRSLDRVLQSIADQ